MSERKTTSQKFPGMLDGMQQESVSQQGPNFFPSFCWSVCIILSTFLSNLAFSSFFPELPKKKKEKRNVASQSLSYLLYNMAPECFVFDCIVFTPMTAQFICDSGQFSLFICCWVGMISQTGFIFFMWCSSKHVFQTIIYFSLSIWTFSPFSSFRCLLQRLCLYP